MTEQHNTADLLGELAQLREELASALERLTSTEHAYGRFVPRQLLQLLCLQNIRDVRLGVQAELKMSILFSDIRDFTSMSESMTPQQNFNFLNSYLSQMEPVISQHRGIIDKFIGDAIMALFPTSANDALLGALGMLGRLEKYNQNRNRAQYQPVRIGIGVNTGIVMLGTIGGSERMDGTVISDAVNLASRLEDMTKQYGISLLITEHTLYDLERPEDFHIRFIDRVVAKGKRESQAVYEVFDADRAPLRIAKLETRQRFEKALAYFHLNHIAGARQLLQQCHAEVPDDEPARIYLERCNKFLRSRRHDDPKEVELTQPWFAEYSSGINFMDEAHQSLLELCNRLILAIRDNDFAAIASDFVQLKDASRQLFLREEALMQEAKYPFMTDHVQQHQRFLARAAQLSAEASAPDFDPIHYAFRTKLLIVDWLVNHSIKFHRHLGHHLKQNG